MKKTFILSFTFIILGIIFGIYLKYIYTSKIINVFSDGKIYYFIQEGVYSNEEIMRENTHELENKITVKNNNKFYVYLGITRDIKIAKKIKEIYNNKGYQIYIKEMNISNEEFYNKVYQFDLLIKNTNNDQEILTIEEVVLSSYEEIINNS